MKNFTKKGSWLDQATLEIKWIYTLFVIFALIGYASFVGMTVFRVGPGVDAILQHYRGADGDEMAFPKLFIELLEVTHFHAYIEGIVLLVLAHLFAACPLSSRTKMAAILTAFGSTLLDLMLPWGIRYAPSPLAPSLAGAQMMAWILMSLSYLPLTCLPLYFLWRSPNRSQ
jgi:hypothetical protein